MIRWLISIWSVGALFVLLLGALSYVQDNLIPSHSGGMLNLIIVVFLVMAGVTFVGLAALPFYCIMCWCIEGEWPSG